MSNIIIPQGWAILRLKDIAEIRIGKNIDSKYFNRDRLGLPYITGASSIQAGVLEIDRWTQHEGGSVC